MDDEYSDVAMTKAELHDMIDQLPEDAVDGVSLLLKCVAMHQIDCAQAWVWADEWQGKLSASLADLEEGRVQQHGSGGEFLEAL